ncbi:MAG: secondary thiamine-phosphate synthase enzyme YjbQ [Nitrospirales bacterium]
MPISTHLLQISMTGDSHIQNITEQLRQALTQSGLTAGVATVFVKHTTASIMIIEDEPGIRTDTATIWNELIPARSRWEHNTRNPGEDNGHSHLRGQLQGPSVVIPFVEGRPTLGAWQQVVVIDFDTRARMRDLVIQIMGE